MKLINICGHNIIDLTKNIAALNMLPMQEFNKNTEKDLFNIHKDINVDVDKIYYYDFSLNTESDNQNYINKYNTDEFRSFFDITIEKNNENVLFKRCDIYNLVNKDYSGDISVMYFKLSKFSHVFSDDVYNNSDYIVVENEINKDIKDKYNWLIAIKIFQYFKLRDL